MDTYLHTANQKEEVLAPVQALIEEYKDVFSEPKELPPRREIEYQIELKPGALPD